MFLMTTATSPTGRSDMKNKLDNMKARMDILDNLFDDLNIVHGLRQTDPDTYRAVLEELNQGTLSWSEAVCIAYLNVTVKETKNKI